MSDAVIEARASDVTAYSAEPERYFFVHLQKTAGTTLVRMIKDDLGIDAVYPNRSDGSFVPVMVVMVNHMLRRWEARRHEIRVVAGHFPLCTVELLGAPFRTFTVLRDPVERTLSYLRFHRSITPEDRHTPLERIYEDRERFVGFVHNHMVKMFSLTIDEMTDGALTPVDFTRDHLERAKANLSRVEVVGVQEHFDQLCADLEQSFGWHLGNRELRRLATELEPVHDDLRVRIAEDNALDMELYEFALELCASRRAARASVGEGGAG
jgi:hypothetical protein